MEMKYRPLGQSGLLLSQLSFGTWINFKQLADTRTPYELIGTAYDNNINYFDHAEVYDSEITFGQVVKELTLPRDSFCVSSKVFWGGEHPTQIGLSRKHVIEACNNALKKLQLEYLDLYFCHRPDQDTPILETVRAMNTLIQQGKILYWGTSEWSSAQISEAFKVAQTHGLTPPTMEQPQYNIFCRERVETEYLPLFETYGLGTTTWSPLCSGLLTGKYNKQIPKDSRLSIERLQWLKKKLIDSPQGQARATSIIKLLELSKKLDIPLSVLSIAWCLKNKNVSSVILGASSVEQLKENLQASAFAESLTKDILEEIDLAISPEALSKDQKEMSSVNWKTYYS